MKGLKQYRIILGFVIVFIVGITSCTDLSENPPSGVTASNFFKNDEQFSAALGAIYNHFTSWEQGDFFRIQEPSTDELVAPQRGQDWYDGGVWIRMHQHTFTYQDPAINGAWEWEFGGVNQANRLIERFERLHNNERISDANAKSTISELKILRAFFYYWLLSDFGNVPIVKSFSNAPKAPSNNSDFQTGRTELFNFIEKGIKDNINNLNRSNTPYQMDVWSAHALLAKLYLNAKVFTGTPRWKDALAQCDSIIDSGKFKLAPDYHKMFGWDNHNNQEFIFAIPYDQVYFPGNSWPVNSMTFADKVVYHLPGTPNNGYCTPEDFYNSFKNNDKRKSGFLVGYQLDDQGNYLFDGGEFNGAPHGDTVYITPKINELYPRAWRKAGARFIKYEPIKGITNWDMNNDVPIFRYADILLMKAELLWRLNKNPGLALDLVNKIRERAGLSDYNSLSAYKILKGRGHELYIEFWRREDLIRFDGGMHYHYKPNGQRGAQYPAGATAFNDAWWAKDVSPTYRNVFPIPRNQMQANPNLHQNPGYSGGK